MKKTFLENLVPLLPVIFLILFTDLHLEAVTYLDFEQFPTDTLLRDQLHHLGLNVIGTGSFSGLVYSEGDYGVKNFGNSPTQIVDVGARNQPTTIEFVDPNNPVLIIGAISVSLLLGDGHPDSEHFQVTWYDPNGIQLAQHDYTTHAEGLFVEASASDLGTHIGSIQLEVLADSSSGVNFDDLTFQLTSDPVTCIRRPRSDLSGDCKVNTLDLAIMASQWLDCGLDIQEACWE